MSQAIIQLSGVNKWFGDVHVLRDVDLAVKQGERMVICGPSGSGKSTLIRCINRLEHHDSGSIVVDGLTLDEDTEHVAAIRREVGMVFQSFNLFPHLSVLENCALPQIRVRGTPRAEAEAKAMAKHCSILVIAFMVLSPLDEEYICQVTTRIVNLMCQPI